MRSLFIEKFRITSKEITKLHLDKLGSRPEMIGVQLSLVIKDHQSKLNYTKGENLDIAIAMTVSLLNADHPNMDPALGCEEAIACRCELEYRLVSEFTSDFKSKKPIPEEYSLEILSLVYDDFRNVIEDTINKTEFRGFYLPVDCRAVLDGASIVKKD